MCCMLSFFARLLLCLFGIFQEKMKLGDIIRKFDFPNVKKNYDNSDDNPSNHLSQFKRQNDSISLEDLKVSRNIKSS